MEDFGLASDLADLPFGTTFTWSSGTYTGSIGDVADSKALDAGGYGLSEDQELVCRTSQFTTRPAPEQTVIIGTTTLRIESVTTSPCDTFLVLRLKTAAKGA